MGNDKKQPLTKEEAIAMLPDGDSIHTFRNPAPSVLVGADWEREEILKAINKYDFELTGEAASAMDHGMAFKDEYGWCFVETRPQESQSC